MEKSRKFVVSVGALVIFFMSWIAWINFKSPIGPETSEGVNLPQPEMVQLRHDLSDFITERFKKERPTSELMNISLQTPSEEGGILKVPYVLAFKDGKLGVESSLSAIAFLEHAGEQWKVTKVLPQKETITFDQNELVKSDVKSPTN